MWRSWDISSTWQYPYTNKSSGRHSNHQTYDIIHRRLISGNIRNHRLHGPTVDKHNSDMFSHSTMGAEINNDSSKAGLENNNDITTVRSLI